MFLGAVGVDDPLLRELRSEETVLWRGRPGIGGILKRENTLTWVAALAVAIGLRLYVTSAESYLPSEASKSLVGTSSLVASILLLGAGVHGIAREISAARRTIYAVTNQRIVIIHGEGRGRVLSVSPGSINASHVAADEWGAGSLVFRSDIVNGDCLAEVGFYGIPEVRQVAEHVERLRF